MSFNAAYTDLKVDLKTN